MKGQGAAAGSKAPASPQKSPGGGGANRPGGGGGKPGGGAKKDAPMDPFQAKLMELKKKFKD
jgi:uncharacterized protein